MYFYFFLKETTISLGKKINEVFISRCVTLYYPVCRVSSIPLIYCRHIRPARFPYVATQQIEMGRERKEDLLKALSLCEIGMQNRSGPEPGL